MERVTPMTIYLISAGVLALLVLAVTSVVGGRQMRRVLREFDTAPGAELVPVALPPVSTLPEPDPDGWSAQRFSPWSVWLDIRQMAADPDAYRQWMDADAKAWLGRQLTDQPPVFAELAGLPVLAIGPAPQRELEGAPS